MEIKFENGIGAVNYFSAMGWEVVTVYYQATSSSYETHYVLRYDSSKDTTALTRAIDDVLKNTPLEKIN